MISIATLNGGNMSIVTGTPGPAGHPETCITFSDGSSDTYEWSGEIDQQTMVDAGLFDDSQWTWIKEPVTVDIGNTVTSIGGSAFSNWRGLTSVTFNSFTKNEVKSMTTNDNLFGETFRDDEWNPIEKTFTVICTDGSMTVHFSADEPATITFTDL